MPVVGPYPYLEGSFTGLTPRNECFTVMKA